MKKRHGFTIVELVIVIAVIAILAAVLIPTFSSIINKANTSADTQLVKNLNTAVAMGVAESGKTTCPTAWQAVQYAEESGYLVAKIVAKSDYEIAWYRATGEFVLIDTENKTAVYPTTSGSEDLKVTDENQTDYFLVLSEMPATTDSNYGFSVYAGEGWSAETVDLVGFGFDAGDSTVVTTVNYTNTTETARDVVIRTNTFGTKLYVNGSDGDTVTHYGFAGLVEVTKVAMASYDEYGVVGRISATADGATGHIDIKEGATVYQVEQLGGTSTKVSVDANATVYDINHEKVDGAIVETTERFTDKIEVEEENIDGASDGERITAVKCNHTYTEDVIDGQHVYEVCKTCGYTVIKVDSNKKTVAASDGENVIIPKAAYDSTQVASNSGDDGEVKINTNSDGSYVTPSIEETPEVDSKTVDTSCSHKWADAVPNGNGKHTITCTKCGASYTAECDKDGDKRKCSKCGYKSQIDVTISYDETTYTKEDEDYNEDRLIYLGDGESIKFTANQDVTWSCESYGGYCDASVTTDGVLTVDGAFDYVIVSATDGETTAYAWVYVTWFHNGNYEFYYSTAEIANAKQWYNMCTLYETSYSGYYYSYGNYKLISDIDMSNTKLEKLYYFSTDFNLDGCNHKVYNITGVNVWGNYSTFFYGDCSIKDITFENCNCSGSCLGYGFDSNYNDQTLIFDNVDLKNCSSYSGSYLTYSITGNVSFVDCDVAGAQITGGTGMSIGGFCGQWHTSGISIDNCTFQGNMTVLGNMCSGFVTMHNNSSVKITNSEIRANSILKNLGSGNINAFSNSLTSDSSNNTFNGKALTGGSGTNIVDITSEQCEIISVPNSSDFELKDGVITYIGSQTYTKAEIYQTVQVDRYVKDEDKWYSSYQWRITDKSTTSNIYTGKHLSGFDQISHIYNLVGSEEELAKCHWSTADRTILDSCIEIGEDQFYLVCDSSYLEAKTWGSGNYYVLTGTRDSEAPESIKITIYITLYDGNTEAGSVSLSYYVSGN